MPVSKDRIRAYRIVSPYIKKAIQELREKNLFQKSHDEFDYIVGNSVNAYLNWLEQQRDALYLYGELARETPYVLWDMPSCSDTPTEGE